MGVHLGRNILQTTRSNSENHAIIRPRIAFSRFAEGQGLTLTKAKVSAGIAPFI
jgi:hypothetical protein